MDTAGALWRTHQLKGKLGAGFTVSSLPSGDKQSTLMSMFVFCMQDGMIWVGNPILPEQTPRCALRGGGQPPWFMVGPDGPGRALVRGGCLPSR
jgi:multimeric flavodoxin WrbA